MSKLEINKVLIGISAGALGVLTLILSVLLVIFQTANAEDTGIKEIVSNTATSEALARFNQELADGLDDKHKLEMGALNEQKDLLVTLSDRVKSLESQSDKITELSKTINNFLSSKTTNIPEQPAVASSSTSITPSMPQRMTYLTYAIENTWDFGEDIIYNHLLTDHNFEAQGYGIEEMKTIHDNLHAGFSAMGGPSLDTSSVNQPVLFTAPTVRRGLFGRLRFSSGSNCATGVCYQ